MATWIVTDAAPGTGPRVAVKDLIDVAGLPTTAACRAVADRLRLASAITPAQVAAAEQVIARWRETLDALWRQVDLLAAPTLLGFPPLLEEAHILFKIRALTSPVNAAGLPALALPVQVPGRNTGPIPANVQLIGPRNGEDRLLAAGALIEQAVRG